VEFSVRDVVIEAVREALKYGVSDVEALAVKRSPLMVKVAKGDVVVRKGEALALGVRVALGKRVTVGGGSVRTLSDVKPMVEAIIKIARASKEDPDWRGLPERISASNVRSPYDVRIKLLDVRNLTNSMLKLSREAKGVDVTEVSFHSALVERAISNTSLEVLEERFTRATGYIEVKAMEGNIQSICHEYHMGYSVDEIKFDELLERASERALRGLKITSVETGRYTVILTPKVVAGIVNTIISPAITADNVQRGRSPLAGKIGESILGEDITIIDDPTREGLYGTTAFDDEGVATRTKVVFRKGVLENFLYDTYTARVEGRESTGNAIRPSITASPRPQPLNLIMESGLENLEDMISKVRRGIVVYETIGEWLSNPISGHLNATITYGELYEDGVFKGVIRGAIVSGNFYQLFKYNIESVSRDLGNLYNVYTPAITIRDAVISAR